MDVKEADWTVRDFRFATGDAMPQLKLHYRTLGAPRIGADGEVENAVLLLHGTTGGGKQLLKPATADALFAPGAPLDAARYYVILPDGIGHGASSKPSDGMKARFPEYTYGDMAKAQHRLVTEHLGIKTLRLVGGTSMGVMHTWMWAEQCPDMMRALLPVASVPGPVRGRNLLWRRILVDAIQCDPGYHESSCRRATWPPGSPRPRPRWTPPTKRRRSTTTPWSYFRPPAPGMRTGCG